MFLATVKFSMPAEAAGSCPAETRTHVAMAYDYFKEYETYSNERNDDMATASYDQMTHELDYVDDHAPMSSCTDRAVNLTFYRMEIRREMRNIIRDSIRDSDNPQILDLDLEGAYETMSLLYDYGFAKTSPGLYAYYKQRLKEEFAKRHKRFKSWEKG